MTTIVLADDHHVVRQGLRALLEAVPGLRVVGDTGDGLAVPELVERLKPDVLIVDVMMPGLNGLEVTRRVSRRSPQTHVVVLSMHANEAYVLEALRAGATAYVLKDSTSDELVRAVQNAVAGFRYLSPPLSELAIEAYVKKAEANTLDPYEMLTAREREVLHLAAEGLTRAEIGKRLSISPRTVETHRANLMRKLGIRNQSELIRYAFQKGILSIEG